MKIVVAYDISDDKRRRKVEKIISAYGIRVNYSVFELDILKRDFKKLISDLQKAAIDKDNIRFYILTKECIEKSFVLNSTEGVFDAQTLYF